MVTESDRLSRLVQQVIELSRLQGDELDAPEPVSVDEVIKVAVDTSAIDADAKRISVVTGGLALAAHFGDGVLRAGDMAAGILGAVVRDPAADAVIWQEYLETVVRERDGWKDFYRACREATAA
jgi:signal transduction histidine kinase